MPVKETRCIRRVIFLFHCLLISTHCLNVSAQVEGRASLGLQSDYAFRGDLEDRDGVILPDLGLALYNGWEFNLLGVWSYQVPGAPEEDGEFSRVHASAAYTIPFDYGSLALGWVEYLFPGGDELEDTREVFALLYARVDFLKAGVDLFYDFDEREDLYAALWFRLDLPVYRELDVGLENRFGFSGDGYTSTGRSGGREWTVKLDAGYPLSEQSEFNVFAEWLSSLDRDVFPEGDEDWLAGLSYQRLF